MFDYKRMCDVIGLVQVCLLIYQQDPVGISFGLESKVG